MSVIIRTSGGRWNGVDYTGNSTQTLGSTLETAMVNAGFARWAPGSAPAVIAPAALSVSDSGVATPVNPATGQPLGGGGGTTFTYDAALQAAKATVDGQEVLAPLRSGGGFRGIVVPRSGTLDALMSIGGNAGETARPTDYRGFVCFTGVVGEAYYVGSDPYRVDVANPATPAVIEIPRGFHTIIVGPLGAIPNATIRSNSGVQINTATGDSFGKNFIVKFSADFTGSAGAYANAMIFGVVVDLSTSGGGFNYFDVCTIVDGAASGASVVNRQSLVY